MDDTTADPLAQKNLRTLEDMRQLWQEADAIWEKSHADSPFSGYVSADYEVVYEALHKLQGRINTFLEWGSGLGVVTIMAARMGFEAYGIEAEPELVEHSWQFAERFGPSAQFAEGSFIPQEFDWQPQYAHGVQQTRTDIEPAYPSLDMELRDFDLVYAYPWPDEYQLFRSIVRTCGNRNALFMSFDAREGLKLERMSRSAHPKSRSAASNRRKRGGPRSNDPN